MKTGDVVWTIPRGFRRRFPCYSGVALSAFDLAPLGFGSVVKVLRYSRLL